MDVITSGGWGAFFEQFTREHAGHRATVAVRHEYGWRNIVRPMTLAGVTTRLPDETAAPLNIRVAGQALDGPVQHTVEDPLYVRRLGALDGGIALLIEQVNGPSTMICVWPHDR